MLQQIYTCKYLNSSCIKMSHNIDGSLGKKVKREGAVSTWVEPLYGEKPKIIFDKKNVVSRTLMFEKYGFCYQGLSPKQLRIGRDLEEAKVEALFGPNISKNVYRYCHKNDEDLKHIFN